MVERPARPLANPNRLAVGQAVVVGVAAALFLRGTDSGPWVLLALFVGLDVVLLVGAMALLTVTYLLGTLTRHGSRLTERPGSRCGWVLLVWVGGAALVGYGRAALGQVGFEPDRHPEGGQLAAGPGRGAGGGPDRSVRPGSSRLGGADRVLRRGHRRSAKLRMIPSACAVPRKTPRRSAGRHRGEDRIAAVTGSRLRGSR
ncbi:MULTISPECIES: hypothetical protein [unclassified Micromonospora]|uniref:hypothetical protein n=1 Tax=unclassified Micromonospora TaxID=2617518 RepID=UPI002FEF913F